MEKNTNTFLAKFKTETCYFPEFFRVKLKQNANSIYIVRYPTLPDLTQ
jgi:hypothetical protein